MSDLKYTQEELDAVKGASGSYQSAQGINVEKIVAEFEKSTLGAIKDLKDPLAAVFRKSADDVKSGIGPETGKMINSMTSTLASMSKAGGAMAAAAASMAKGVVDLLLNVVNRTNALWKQSMGGVEATLRGMNTIFTETLNAGLSKALGPVTGPKMAGAIGGFLDNVISSMTFRFKEGLAYRQTKQSMEAQMGRGEGGGAASSAMGKSWALGRDEASQWGKELAGIGTSKEDFDAVLNKSLQIGKTMGMNAGETAKLQQSYVSFGNSGVEAGNKIEQNLRKIQAAAKGTGLSVSMMSGYIVDAATQARKFNVDVGLIGNTMAMLATQSKNLGAFGVDMKIHGGQIMKDFATGGSKMNDAMHMFIGSKGGTEDVGLKAITKSKFGEKNAETLAATSGGGFSMASSDKNMMMVNRLETMKDMMVQASAAASNADEALQIQTMMAKDMFGMSDEAATSLAVLSKQNIGEELKKNPALTASFKDTNTLLENLQTLAAKDEQMQRELVKINMKQLLIAAQTPNLFGALADSLSTDKNRQKSGATRLSAVGAFSADAFKDIVDSSKGIGKLLQSFDPETFKLMGDMMGKIRQQMITADLQAKGKLAEGGRINFADGGRPSYTIGELGQEKFFPDGPGYIQSNSDLRDMEKEKQNNTQGININLYVSGQTKQQMLDSLSQEINKQFA